MSSVIRRHPQRMKARQILLWTAAGFSIGAALIHGWVTPEHWEEWIGYGLFFIVAAIAQCSYGIVLVLQGRWLERLGGSGRWTGSYTTILYILGIVGNLLIIGMYIVSRTVGVPLFGPAAGEVETVEVFGLTATIIEVMLIICLLALVGLTVAR